MQGSAKSQRYGMHNTWLDSALCERGFGVTKDHKLNMSQFLCYTNHVENFFAVEKLYIKYAVIIITNCFHRALQSLA